MIKDQLHSLVITLGLFVLAFAFAWRGESDRALFCVALIVPNAQQTIRAFGAKPASFAEIAADLEKAAPQLATNLKGIISAVTPEPMKIPGPTIGSPFPNPMPAGLGLIPLGDASPTAPPPASDPAKKG